MREILFRGKTEQGKWLYGYLVKGNYNTGFGIIEDHIDTGLQYVEEETVGQFTGLTDKNGKKIFEGDICKHRSSYSGEFIISVVTYSDGCFLAMADKNSGFNLSDKLEVIGNIHNNTELLGE